MLFLDQIKIYLTLYVPVYARLNTNNFLIILKEISRDKCLVKLPTKIYELIIYS